MAGSSHVAVPIKTKASREVTRLYVISHNDIMFVKCLFKICLAIFYLHSEKLIYLQTYRNYIYDDSVEEFENFM